MVKGKHSMECVDCGGRMVARNNDTCRPCRRALAEEREPIEITPEDDSWEVFQEPGVELFEDSESSVNVD